MIVNTPRAMLERLAFACFLVWLVASFGLTGLGLLFGLHSGDPRPVILGLAGLLVFVALRPYGYKHLHFREWEESFELVEDGYVLVFDAAQEERARELAAVLAAIDNIQRSTDSGAIDVWEVQRLRHRAALLLATDPALRARFAPELAEHPELG